MVVDPGSIRTSFARTVQAHSSVILTNAASPYYALYQHDRQLEAAMRRQEARPAPVSAVVQRALAAPRPKARYLAAVPFAARVTLHLGDAGRDRVFRRALQIAPPAPGTVPGADGNAAGADPRPRQSAPRGGQGRSIARQDP